MTKSQIPNNLSDTELFINDNFIMLKSGPKALTNQYTGKYYKHKRLIGSINMLFI